MVLSLTVALAMLANERNAVPTIARAAGITVGLTTIRQFERKHGKGLILTGGHPRGAREWFDRTSKTLITADGFCFSDQGEVIDGLAIEWPGAGPIDPHVPRIRLSKRELGLLAKLQSGMTTNDVERILGMKLTGSAVKATGLIKFRERLVNKDNDRFTQWEARFGFGPRGLSSINILAD